MTLPQHLGGHLNRTHIDEGALDWLIKQFGITSLLDVGAATGGMVRLAQSRGLRAHGIEGDFTLDLHPRHDYTIHDFTTGPAPVVMPFDLIWCCAFVEHIEPQYESNFLQAFAQGRYLVMTYYQGPGHHHVNLQPEQYWIDRVQDIGFEFKPDFTKDLRQHSTMNIRGGKVSRKAWIRHYGLMFQRKDPT